MRRIFYTLFILIGMMHGTVSAQTLRTAYHHEGYIFGHELNPAFQPEESYMSLPVLGNTSVSTQSSLGLGDIIYDTKDGGLTTFMAKGTISKSALMDKVGSAFSNYVEGNLTLISLGRRLNDKRYQTLSVSMRGKSATRIDKSLFDLLKDVENKYYRVKDTRIDASAYAEIAVGESRKLNEHWTVGAKAKLLIGLNHIDLSVDNINVSLNENEWIAQGQVSLQAAGFRFKTEMKDYKEVGRGQYESVTGLSYMGFVPRGVGMAIDAGATYKYNENWTFSAAVRDFGFMCWIDNRRAWNSGETFTFDGVHGVCLHDPDDEYQAAHPTKESLRSQLDRLGDDLMTIAHLERKVTWSSLTQMLGATLHAGAKYSRNQWTAGALVTSYIQGNLSWFEGRLSATYEPVKHLNFTVAPAWGTTGFSVGAMASYEFKNGINLHLGSDALTATYTRQMIPTSLCTSVQFGMTFAIR